MLLRNSPSWSAIRSGRSQLQPERAAVTARKRCTCWSAGSDAAAAPGSPPPQPQQQSIQLPTPLGPTEPPEEAPKKLSPHARLSETLSSCSITIVGDDTELNWAVCQALSKKIGWFPVSTSKVLLGMHKAASLDELVQQQGREAVVAAEASMLKGMKGQMRCCVATIGDGAAADASLYSNLFGTIIIWLDEQDKRSPKPASATRALYYQQGEVRAALQKTGGGFGDKDLAADDKAQKAAGQLIKAMNQLLKEHEYLPAKKRLYVEMGCRGDWPELKPADWNPVLEGLGRQPAADQQQPQ